MEFFVFFIYSYGDTLLLLYDVCLRMLSLVISFNCYNKCVDKLTYLALVTDRDLERLVKETEGKLRCFI